MINDMNIERQTAKRYILLDAVRGFAVLLMIFFHLAYDLNLFRFIRIDIFKDPFWFGLPRLIASLFLICVGISLAIVHKSGIRWDLIRKRFFIIGGWAVVITGVTYFLFPKNYVYFGILHCIAVSGIIGLFFVNRPKISLLIGIALVGSDIIVKPVLLPISGWLEINPMDYVPLYPWFGLVLIGIFLEHIRFHKIPLGENLFLKPFVFMGRHALMIYMLHRPILYGSVLTLYRLKTAS
jgi:uncharacterized membrane protein